MDSKTKVKIVTLKSDGSTLTYESIIGEQTDSKACPIEFKTRTSVTALPTAHLIISVNETNEDVLSLKTHEKISIALSEDDKEFVTMFTGLFKKVTINTDLSSAKVTLDCVSSLYILQYKKLDSKTFKSNIGLRGLVSSIIKQCGLNNKVEVDSRIPDDFDIGYFKNFSAQSLLMHICKRLDLVFDVDCDDRLKLTRRSDMLSDLENSVPITIDSQNIRSSEFEQ